MDKVAIIDLGTNTFNVLIGQFNASNQFERIAEDKIAVKLGEGGINKGIIATEAFNRGIIALEQYKQLTNDLQVSNVYLFATSAIRNASNGIEFAETVKQKFNWNINIIDGNTEAQYIYYGVRNALSLGKEPTLIMDIGGGSTEFIIANHNEVLWKKSYELGAARLLEKFNPSEPITPSEIETIFSYLDSHLNELKEEVEKHHINILVGSSGSFDSYADVILDRYYGGKNLNGNTTMDFSMQEFNETYQLFIRSNREQRTKIKGLVAMRIDMIVIASLLIKFIVDRFQIKHIRLSTYSLKEGVLWAIQNKLIN